MHGIGIVGSAKKSALKESTYAKSSPTPSVQNAWSAMQNALREQLV
jgi:hypothetical protein